MAKHTDDYRAEDMPYIPPIDKAPGPRTIALAMQRHPAGVRRLLSDITGPTVIDLR